MPVLQAGNVRRLNVYDAFGINDREHPDRYASGRAWPLAKTNGTVRLFGNANIGCNPLTNLQVPGQLASDQSAAIEHWYARTDAPADLTGQQRASLKRFTEGTYVTFILGDMPQPTWHQTLASLLNETPWEPPTAPREREGMVAMEAFLARFNQRNVGRSPLVVPWRQVFAVMVEAPQDLLRQVVEDLGESQVMAWIHLEGMSIWEDRRPRPVIPGW